MQERITAAQKQRPGSGWTAGLCSPTDSVWQRRIGLLRTQTTDTNLCQERKVRVSTRQYFQWTESFTT